MIEWTIATKQDIIQNDGISYLVAVVKGYVLLVYQHQNNFSWWVQDDDGFYWEGQKSSLTAAMKEAEKCVD